jgi:hypothetical protein
MISFSIKALVGYGVTNRDCVAVLTKTLQRECTEWRRRRKNQNGRRGRRQAFM